MTMDSRLRLSRSGKHYQSCESLSTTTGGTNGGVHQQETPPSGRRRGPAGRPHVAMYHNKRKLYQSCEALNAGTAAELYPLPPPEDDLQYQLSYHSNPFLLRDKDYRLKTNNNNNNYNTAAPGFGYVNSAKRQHRGGGGRKERYMTLNSGKTSSAGRPGPVGSRPQLHTYFSVDMDASADNNGSAGRIFNSSSVPCLLDYPDNSPVRLHPSHNHRAPKSQAPAGALGGGGRTYAVSGVPPPKPPRFTNQPTSQTAHKSLVRPIACKPVVTPQQQQRYAGASPQQPSHPGPLPRPTPHNASPHSNSSTSRIAMVTPGSPPLGSPPPRPPPYESAAATKLASVNQSQDDGYVSQEYHSHTNSLASNHGAAPPPPPQNGGGGTALHSQYGNNAPQPQPMTNGYHGNHNNQQTVPNHHGNNSNAMQNLHHHGNRANQQGYGVHSSNGSGPLSPRPAHQYSQQPETMNSPKVTYLTDSGQKVITADSGSLGSAKRPDSYSSANSIVAATTRQLESYTPASSSRSHPDSRPNSYTHRDSNGSLQQSAPRDDSFNSSSNRAGAGADSSLNSSSGRGMMNDSSFVTQTPSPSDSGVGELEVILREKDAQIRQLRETMERNETAILQVCEEKQQNWEVRWRELSAEWEQRLRHQTQKAFKMEQALLMQLFKLQQERKDLRSEVEELRGRQQTHDALMLETGDEIKALKTKLEELQWDMCQKVGEISHLKTQLKEAKEDNAVKANELVAIKSQLKESQQESGEKNGEILGLESELKLSQDELKQAKLEIESLKKQLQNNNSPKPEPKANGLSKDNAVVDKCDVESELAKCREQFEKEREKWLAEKDKVIRYQRHLQLNYVQMANKNKLLEAEVQQLTLELERSDVCLQDVEEGEESVC